MRGVFACGFAEFFDLLGTIGSPEALLLKDPHLMPLDRYDAVVIGAGVEGLTAALTLALAGKRTLCVERLSRPADLGGFDAAWVSPVSARALGLFDSGLLLCAPSPQLALNGGHWTALWPDAERTSSTMSEVSAGAFLETVARLKMLRTALREPGAAARAMLHHLDLVRTNSGAIPALRQFLRAPAAEWLAQHHVEPQMRGLMLAMAARNAPVSPYAIATAPMLLSLAPFFDDKPSAPKPVAGGARSLVGALLKAYEGAGGEIALGRDVSEILMEREIAAGVALDGNTIVKSALVVAAVAPKRLSQGLLSTRRYGRLLSGLSAAPRKFLASLRLELSDGPSLPEARLGLWRGGVSVWLGALEKNLAVAAEAMRERMLPETPIVEMRFQPDMRMAIAVAPYCPGELTEGPWTAGRRDALRQSILSAIRTRWPEAHGLIKDAELLTPKPPDILSGTGAIFGGAERVPDIDTLFALGAEAPWALLKGVYLCHARALEPDCQAGMAAAGAAAGLSQIGLRA
jgi:phytoene dehydrogenase-like protein